MNTAVKQTLIMFSLWAFFWIWILLFSPHSLMFLRANADKNDEAQLPVWIQIRTMWCGLWTRLCSPLPAMKQRTARQDSSSESVINSQNAFSREINKLILPVRSYWYPAEIIWVTFFLFLGSVVPTEPLLCPTECANIVYRGTIHKAFVMYISI